MLFSSLEFLLIFLPLVIIVYYIVPMKYRNIRNLVLFIASLFFYAWGEPVYVFLMFFEIVINYFLALEIERNKKPKQIFVLTLLIDIGVLVYFKYSNFFLNNLNMLLGTQFSNIDLSLPIGISFYTFQMVSYIIDVYRKKAVAQKNFLILATYIVLFPQLIAGPIVRYIDIEKRMRGRAETFDQFAEGLRRLIVGLGKKVIIADQLGIVANTVYANYTQYRLTGIIVLVGTLAFSLQLYYDFSGYSDMAIGLGKMFGFDFLENFNYPYCSTSITDFWRRWHISLGSWFRDYVYIPLGGNRVSKIKWIRNIMIVWILTGFWHGASWNMICWGLYFGILLLIEKEFGGKILKKLPILNWVITFGLINVGFIIFNSSTLEQAFSFLRLLLFGEYRFDYYLFASLDFLRSWFYFLIAFVGMTPIAKKIIQCVNRNRIGGIFYDLYLFGVLGISIVFIAISNYSPFLYFRF